MYKQLPAFKNQILLIKSCQFSTVTITYLATLTNRSNQQKKTNSPMLLTDAALVTALCIRDFGGQGKSPVKKKKNTVTNKHN